MVSRYAAERGVRHLVDQVLHRGQRHFLDRGAAHVERHGPPQHRHRTAVELAEQVVQLQHDDVDDSQLVRLLSRRSGRLGHRLFGPRGRLFPSPVWRGS